MRIYGDLSPVECQLLKSDWSILEYDLNFSKNGIVPAENDPDIEMVTLEPETKKIYKQPEYWSKIASINRTKIYKNIDKRMSFWDKIFDFFGRKYLHCFLPHGTYVTDLNLNLPGFLSNYRFIALNKKLKTSSDVKKLIDQGIVEIISESFKRKIKKGT